MQQYEFLPEPPTMTAGRRHANIIVMLLALFYLSWQFLMPLFTLLVPGVAMIYAGTLSAIVLTVMTFAIHSRDFMANAIGIFKWALVMAVIGLMSSILTVSMGTDTLSMVYQLFSIACVFATFAALSRFEGSLRIIIWTLVILATFNAFIAIWGAKTGSTLLGAERDVVGVGAFGYDASTGRSGGLRGENYAGTWSAPALAVGLLLVLQWKWKFTPKGIFLVIIGGTLAGIAGVGVAVSLSRTSAACAAMVFIAAAIMNFMRKKTIGNVVFPLVGMLCAYLVLKVVVSAQSEHFTNVVGSEQSERWGSVGNLFSDRIGVWWDALSMGLNSPLWGNGPGSIATQLEDLPHNSFLDAFVELGIFGAVVFFAPVIKVVIKLFRKSTGTSRDKYLAPLACMLFGMLATWAALSNMYMKLVWIVAALIVGRIAHLKELDTQAQWLQYEAQAQSYEEPGTVAGPQTVGGQS